MPTIRGASFGVLCALTYLSTALAAVAMRRVGLLGAMLVRRAGRAAR